MSTVTAYHAIGADPDSALAFIELMGKAFHQGGLAGCKSEGQGKAMALTCLCDNMTPLRFMQTYHLMDGKPTMQATAMLANFMGDGGKWKWKNQGDDGKSTSAHVVYGDNDMEISYTIEDAKKAGLVKPNSNWAKDPGSMLRARCVSKAIRMVAPHIVAGVYTPEEMGDLDSAGSPSDVTGTVVSSKTESEAPATRRPRKEKTATAAAETPGAKATQTETDEPAAKEASSKATGEQMLAEAGDSGAVEFVNSDLRNEIQTIQTQFELTKSAYAWMASRDIEHVNNLTVQQARRLLVDLYVEGLGFTEKRDSILASQELESLDDASEELVQQMLESLRAKHESGN